MQIWDPLQSIKYSSSKSLKGYCKVWRLVRVLASSCTLQLCRQTSLLSEIGALRPGHADAKQTTQNFFKISAACMYASVMPVASVINMQSVRPRFQSPSIQPDTLGSHNCSSFPSACSLDVRIGVSPCG